MPIRRDARLRHLRRFLEVIQNLYDLDDFDDSVRSAKLNELENVWMQVAKARDWARENAQADSEAERLAKAFDNAGVDIAQIRAETRLSLRRLKDSLLGRGDVGS